MVFAAHCPDLGVLNAQTGLSCSRGKGPHEAKEEAQIKNEKTYSKLRGKGEGKEKAARISNAMANDKGGTSKSAAAKVGRKGGKSAAYEDWSKPDLVRRAREIGIRAGPQ